MVEVENGFEVSIKLKDYNTFNFCFKNNYNIWDNNSGFNYIAPIEEPKQIQETSNEPENQNIENAVQDTKEEIAENNIENTKTDSVAIVENTIEEINNNIDKEIDKIISQIFEEPNNIDKNRFQLDNETEDIKDKIEEISEETNNTDRELEKEFNELLDSILQFDETPKVNVDFENGFGLQSVDEIKEISFTDCDDIFQELYDNKDNNEDNKETENSNPSELENLLNALIERQNEQYNTEESEAINVKDLKELINNLNSIIENDNINETSDEETVGTEFKISELPVKQKNSEDFLDNFIDKSYNFFQKVWTGCKKIGTLIKQTAKNLLGEEK